MLLAKRPGFLICRCFSNVCEVSCVRSPFVFFICGIEGKVSVKPSKAQVDFRENHNQLAVCRFGNLKCEVLRAATVPSPAGPLTLKDEIIAASLPSEFVASLLKPCPGCPGPSAFGLGGL